MNLSTPLNTFTRLGATLAPKLKRLGLTTVGDLLYYFPVRYEDYRSVVPIKNLAPGSRVTVRGTVELIGNKRSFKTRKTLTEALVTDASGTLRVVWFNQPYVARVLPPGTAVFLSGVVKIDRLGPQLLSPTYERVTDGPTVHTARLVPVYPLTAGITEKQLRFLIQEALPVTRAFTDWLPPAARQTEQLLPLGAALAGIHFPSSERELKAATERLKFDELLLVQLKTALTRRARVLTAAPPIPFPREAMRQFVGTLPFALTRSQKVAAWGILQDLSGRQPMNRLLSGDVGAGKTVVAALAVYQALVAGYQAAFMAPTEILAAQHFRSFGALLGRQATVGLLTSSQCLIFGREFSSASKSGQKKEWLALLKSGAIQVAVGTHALLPAAVTFHRLGLVVVDEQHRFGVAQRQLIKTKQAGTHFLSMTATPIPRSLALVLYGELDLSTIDESPPGRKPIITRLVEPGKRDRAYQFIRGQVQGGRQVFVVCPLIEEGQGTRDKEKGERGKESVVPLFSLGRLPALERKSVLSEYKKLSGQIFPDLRVGFLHGKLAAKEKAATMEKFKTHALDILVSTSVVEVGVDVPNASLMMIEGAENFGLAQLHQFRGRVGRATHQSYCLLFTSATGGPALERLHWFEKQRNGFALAEKDLEWRGPGELFGTEQSGRIPLKIARLTDSELIARTRRVAASLAPIMGKFPPLLEHFTRWEQRVHFE